MQIVNCHAELMLFWSLELDLLHCKKQKKKKKEKCYLSLLYIYVYINPYF